MPVNLSPADRDRIFGPLRVKESFGRDSVKFEKDPPVVAVKFGRHTVRVHELAAESLKAIAAELEAAELLGSIVSIVGYQPRLVRNVDGSNAPNLSAHAYGAAVDVNHDANPQGTLGTEQQAELAPFFERHGWFWGRYFGVPDPHHFAFQGTDPLATALPPRSAEEEESDELELPDEFPRATSSGSSAGLGLALLALGVGVAVAMKNRR